MLLELGKFGSLLLSILCLIALFHTAFLMPANSFDERAFACLEMLALAACASWASAWIFCRWERRTGVRSRGVITSFPMMLFWWTAGTMLVLFVSAWYLETYFPPWKPVNRW